MLRAASWADLPRVSSNRLTAVMKVSVRTYCVGTDTAADDAYILRNQHLRDRLTAASLARLRARNRCVRTDSPIHRNSRCEQSKSVRTDCQRHYQRRGAYSPIRRLRTSPAIISASTAANAYRNSERTALRTRERRRERTHRFTASAFRTSTPLHFHTSIYASVPLPRCRFSAGCAPGSAMRVLLCVRDFQKSAPKLSAVIKYTAASKVCILINVSTRTPRTRTHYRSPHPELLEGGVVDEIDPSEAAVAKQIASVLMGATAPLCVWCEGGDHRGHWRGGRGDGANIGSCRGFGRGARSKCGCLWRGGT